MHRGQKNTESKVRIEVSVMHKVLVNRPLNGYDAKGEWRLARYEDPMDYEEMYSQQIVV